MKFLQDLKKGRICLNFHIVASFYFLPWFTFFVIFYVPKGQFSALQRDHYLSVFWSPPRYDLKLSSAREEEEGQVIPWPDIELLFGKDEEYMSMVQNVLKLVAENMESVEQYTQVYFHSIIID